jgi:hypothetical protein
MDIIVNPQRFRRGASTFMHGLGLAPSTKAEVQARAQELLVLILKLQPDVKTYRTQLRAVDPWWADNFDDRLMQFYPYRDSIDKLSEGVPALQEAYNNLESMITDYRELEETLKAIKNPPATGEKKRPRPFPKDPPPSGNINLPPVVKKQGMSVANIAAGVIAVAALLLIFTSKEE